MISPFIVGESNVQFNVEFPPTLLILRGGIDISMPRDAYDLLNMEIQWPPVYAM